MSNVKISQLPAAVSLVPAADSIPIVTTGVTKKTTPNLLINSVLVSPGPIGLTTPNTGAFSTLTLTGASGLQKATAGVFSNAIAGTDYLGPTTGSAIQKANGTGGLTNAVSGTDYAPATSGSSILYGNGAGGFSNVTVGSGLSFAGGTLVSTSGGGSVTTVSVVTANGFAGTVANASSTPAITLSTSVTGLLKGNGTAISAATSGTDYAPATSGTSILYGDGSGGFSNVTIGSNLTFAGGTLSATAGGSGTVTSVSGTGTVNGLTLTGTVTTSGSLTLGGTLDLSAPPAIGGTIPAAITGTTVTANTKFVGPYFDASGSGGGALRTSGGSACLQWGAGGGVNLTLDGAFNMNPANATISIAPTGTGTLTINPATAGTINNVAIGGTTAAAGTFTALTATGTTTLATSLTGLLKAASGVVSTATAGTDYIVPGGALGTPSSGTLSSCTVDGTNSVGFRNIPQNAQNSSYTLVAGDSGKHIYNASGTSITYTIPANGSVAYAVGTAITFANMSSTSTTIAINTDTLYLAGTGTTGSRTLAQYGVATAVKITSTSWIISGTGLT